MNEQELIDRAVAAGIDAGDAERMIFNAPFMAAEYGMKPIETLEQFAGLLLYKVRRHLDYVANGQPFSASKGVCLYDATAWMNDVNKLSVAGIYPTSQRDLFPPK